MLEQTPLIATIVGCIVIGFIFGTLANKLSMPPLIGYLVAGILVGPYTPGFVADGHLAQELAEIGVILLMFGVGLHFSLKDLLAVKSIAIPGALLQIFIAMLLGLGLTVSTGLSMGEGIIFGLALSCASTVVLLTALQSRGLINTQRGQIAIGWLIVEDIVMVLALVLIPALCGPIGSGEVMGTSDLLTTLTITMGKVIAFVAVMLIFGKRAIPWILEKIAATGSRELFGICVLAIALGFALGSTYLFGVSFALGAFFAGMMLAESPLNHRVAEESLPLRELFSVLFFVSVGMLFDPSILMRKPLLLCATVAIIVVGKSVVALLLVRAFGRPLSTALTISASLAQIGEFSFILATLGISLGILSSDNRDLILAGAIFSIILNPLLFFGLDRLKPWLDKIEGNANSESATRQQGHTILVGYGELGKLVADELKAQHHQFVIIEDHADMIHDLHTHDIPAIYGHANAPVLEQAEIHEARCMILTISDAIVAGQLISYAHSRNPGIISIARANSEDEEQYLRQRGATHVMFSKREVAKNLVRLITQ